MNAKAAPLRPTCFFLIWLLSGCGQPKQPPVVGAALRQASRQPSPAALTCAVCHPAEFEEWRTSQHAGANRLVDEALDGPVFSPPARLSHGSFHTTMRRGRGGSFEFATVFSNQPAGVFRAEAVIGITPLRQYLVGFPGGRLQVMDPAYDPRGKEWFPVFGEENRQPGEWGHWTGRSMTWNAQCAFCHMTGFQKNYDPATDRYASTWSAMGISCLQCHPLTPEPSVHGCTARVKLSGPQVEHNCASCHARREEFNDAFRAGADFHDHYRLTLPDQPGIFYGDGQVRNEDFEYASLQLSRMGHRGVTCLDCHLPHSGRLKAPVENNALCLQCHTPPGVRGAIPINPTTHMFHPPGTPGGRCVDCHMPENTYMVRDSRRDHGFTSPDPQLTLEQGTPNACNRCHQNQTPAWAVNWTERWYGSRMNRRARERARAVVRHGAGETAVATQLLALAQSEEISAWRAALVGMLGSWPDRPDIQAFLRTSLAHPHPLVRSAAIRSLQDASATLLDDPAAMVRLDATQMRWARDPLHPPPNRQELIAYLNHISDQPAGALRQSQRAYLENRHLDAERWTEKARLWDPLAAPPYHQLGHLQFARGATRAGCSNLLEAARLETNNPTYSMDLALALAETGESAAAMAWLEETVRRDPGFGRAWYNLGLSYAQAGRRLDALNALQRAESMLPGSGDPAYAQATLHLQLNQHAAAMAALQRALIQEPHHAQAQRLLRQTGKP